MWKANQKNTVSEKWKIKLNCAIILLKLFRENICLKFRSGSKICIKEPCICGGIFDVSAKEKRLQELEQLMASSSFWDDQETAKTTIAESNELKSWIEPISDVKRRLEDVKSLLADAGSDEQFMQELSQEVLVCEKNLEKLEARRMLSGEMDKANCFLSVNAGAGGTEACDWAQMLFRMYERYAENKGWTVEIIDVLEGEVAGIRSGTIRIIGEFAYGHCRAEKGVHRLVRISPFDSNARRHTSFAAVDVTPEVSDDIEIDIKPDEIRTDTYRASGAGGQHVNKTDSAVRITHIPTGVVVCSQQQRSQPQNREYCMKLLRAKLYELKMEERQKKIDSFSEDKKKIEWGSQIRSYTFQPYTLVKDSRTKVEVGDVQSVMNGELDSFIYAYLKEFGSAR